MDKSDQPYIVALRLTAYVQQAIRGIATWRELDRGLEVAEVTVALSTWKQARRLIVIRQHVPTRPQASGKQPLLFQELEQHREYRYSVLVTNDTTLSAEELWRTYRPRANEENCIKELKEGYGWHEFNVRSFRLPDLDQCGWNSGDWMGADQSRGWRGLSDVEAGVGRARRWKLTCDRFGWNW